MRCHFIWIHDVLYDFNIYQRMKQDQADLSEINKPHQKKAESAQILNALIGISDSKSPTQVKKAPPSNLFSLIFNQAMQLKDSSQNLEEARPKSQIYRPHSQIKSKSQKEPQLAQTKNENARRSNLFSLIFDQALRESKETQSEANRNGSNRADRDKKERGDNEQNILDDDSQTDRIQDLEKIKSEDIHNKLVPTKQLNRPKSQISNQIRQQRNQQKGELIRVRNNLLLLLLILSAYGIYFLIGDFIDILLTAFIAGIAYQQTRKRFTEFIVIKTNQKLQYSMKSRIIRCLFWFILILLLPKLRQLVSHISRFDHIPTYQQIFDSFLRNRNFLIIFCQAVMGLRIAYLLFKNQIILIGEKIRPSESVVKNCFLIISLLVTISAILIIPSVMFREISSVGYLAEQKIEQKLGCQIISIQEHNNQTLPYCSEMITSENQFIRQTIAEFKDQNETIEKCIGFLKKVQNDYVGREYFSYDEVACTWYTFLHKAYNYSGIAGSGQQSTGDLVMTGTNIFKTFFGNLTLVLSSFSNFIFSATTFLTMFILTTQTFDSFNSLHSIFSDEKQQLVSSITDLIQATFLIVFQHFIASIILLEIFDFTSINFLIATILSSMAFFPFFRPWFGILLVGLIKFLITRDAWTSLLVIGIYYFISEQIYSVHYRKMEIHQIVTNMSVLFGIYRFGIAGIFYGPLIVILFQFVERALTKS